MTPDGRQPALIALDWGTSSLRAYLLGRDGAVLDMVAGAKGIMQVTDRDFAAVFDEVTREWRRKWPALRAIAAGMIGSAQGWTEAKYLSCPASVTTLADGLVSTPGGEMMIVPGIAQYGPSANVMRGEETQIAGALALEPGLAGSSRIVLPGTHSKWVSVGNGAILDFSTYMTGELFAVLKTHSILGRFAKEGTDADEGASAAAFRRGIDAAREARDLGRLLFSARALVLTGGMTAGESLDYLSGLLIGDEIASALAEGVPNRLTLIGDPALCRRYRTALAVFGVTDVGEVDNAAVAGLWRIARANKLII